MMTTRTRQFCTVADCGKPRVSHGLCDMHRQRIKKTGDPLVASIRDLNRPTHCTLEDCPRPVHTLGMCKTHYDQQYHGRAFKEPRQMNSVFLRNEVGNKRCYTCDRWLPESDFSVSKAKADRLQSRCRSCGNAIYRQNADRIRDNARIRRFGVTPEAFAGMLEAQGNACAICRSTDPGSTSWSIDHDHACCPSSDKTCGKCVRGLLCRKCNVGLGHMNDSAAILRSAIDYLERTG